MNLEFIQWMKILHDTVVDANNHDYNAEERMKAAGVKPIEPSKIGGGAVKRTVVSAAKKENTQPVPKASAAAAAAATAPAAPAAKGGADDSGKVAELALEITDLKLTVDGLEKASARAGVAALPCVQRVRPSVAEVRGRDT